MGILFQRRVQRSDNFLVGVIEILRFALNDKKEALNDKCGWESLKVKEYGFESCDIGGVESADA